MEHLIIYKSPFTKKRIGKNNDGGYVIVDLPGDYDVFLSGGVSNDISFEIDFLKSYPNLWCFAFDGTVNLLPEINNKIVFIKKNLGNHNNSSLTNLQEYMKDYNNIFMKIDIEGHEFRLLPTFFENDCMKKIKQLVIEIHSPADIKLFPEYFKGLSDITNEFMFNLFKKINNTHTLVHLHANNGCKMNNINGINIPHVFELTYIRNEFITEKILNDQPLPTNIDMKNIYNLPDYTLSGFPYTL